MDLFDFHNTVEESKEGRESLVPLAESLRPKNLSGFFTDEKCKLQISHVLDTIKKTGRLPSLILWGPPGTGKTTLALILAACLENTKFIQVNAIDAGAKRLKEIGSQGRESLRVRRQPTVLFIDEIHRLNKAQQDVLLPFTESGALSLIGATTENPGYELNAALLSRSRVIRLERHSQESLESILSQIEESRSVNRDQLMDAEALDWLFQYSDGDARKFINVMESIVSGFQSGEVATLLTAETLRSRLESNVFHYDKASDEHYNTISAFIKSVRGSDPDASVYYLARMLEGGEDPKFIARRLVILASEDIGNADPRALTIASSGFLAVEKVGLPEAAIVLSQVTCYLACCPKSNRAYKALLKAQNLVREYGHLPIPQSLRSAQTQFAKGQGYGEGYRYSHDGEKGYLKQDFLPEQLKRECLYEPSGRGFEKNIQEYLNWVKQS